MTTKSKTYLAYTVLAKLLKENLLLHVSTIEFDITNLPECFSTMLINFCYTE